MSLWRDSLIMYLQKAWEAGQILQHNSLNQIPTLLRVQSRRRWIVDTKGPGSKKQLIRYAGRYLRRLPIAEHRILSISNGTVAFLSKNRKLKRVTPVTMPLSEFVK